MQTERLTHLSLFKIHRYISDEGAICDFIKSPRPCFFLATILNGAADFESSSGETFHANAGDLIFIPKGAKYRSIWSKTHKNIYISLRFDFEPLSGFPNPETLSVQNFPKESALFLSEKIKSIYVLSEEKAEDQLRALAFFFECLSAIFPLLKRTPLPTNDHRLSPAIDYIRTHLSEDTPVPYLAKLCNMSEPNLYLLFRKQLLESPVEYKNRLRIERAIQLLQSEKAMPIEEIATAVGYETAAYFRRRFKDAIGESPREFRKRSTEKL